VNARRSLATGLAALVLVALPGSFVPASAATTERQLVADGLAQAFTLRATVDYGGASKLPFFFGSYADATLSNPPAAADGQASWYNLGIAEAAVFTPAPPDPNACTQAEQQRRIAQAGKDVSDWVTGVAIPTLMAGNIPVLPLPTLPCTERLPGFSQSRYPATRTIGESATDDLLGSGLCHVGACAARDALAPRTGGVIDGGRFVATATDKPSQRSDAQIVGMHVPGLDIGAARSIATATIDGERLITQAIWAATDVCVVPGAGGCALSIASISQIARLERDGNGKVIAREARTVIAGVSGGGQAGEVTAADLGPGLPPLDLGGRLQIRGVSSTAGCGDPASGSVADAGGLEITGNGGGGPGVSLPIPIAGSATGGGLLLGGACASGRLDAVTISLPGPSSLGGGGTPGRTILVPPPSGPAPGITIGDPVLSAPRVVRKDSVRYVLRRAPAWRTAPYWASLLGALALACALGYIFRRSRPVVPFAAAIDRFARQFVRG
jgi:hypothetical protein